MKAKAFIKDDIKIIDGEIYQKRDGATIFPQGENVVELFVFPEVEGDLSGWVDVEDEIDAVNILNLNKIII